MFLEDDELWMDEALRVAADGLAVTELPIGAVVVHDGAIIAAAYAQERTQGRLLVHADFLALDAADRLLGRDRREAKLYVTLEPCLGCLEAAMTAMIGGVVYALASPIDGAGSFAMEWDKTRSAQDFPGYRLPHIRGGVRSGQAAALFRQYIECSSNETAFTRWAQSLLHDV